MAYMSFPFEINVRPDGFIFLAARRRHSVPAPDQPEARRLHCAPVTVWVFIGLAKLGEPFGAGVLKETSSVFIG